MIIRITILVMIMKKISCTTHSCRGGHVGEGPHFSPLHYRLSWDGTGTSGQTETDMTSVWTLENGRRIPSRTGIWTGTSQGYLYRGFETYVTGHVVTTIQSLSTIIARVPGRANRCTTKTRNTQGYWGREVRRDLWRGALGGWGVGPLTPRPRNGRYRKMEIRVLGNIDLVVIYNQSLYD